MKKLLLAFMAMILAVCAYANTCTYDGVKVTLRSETVEFVKGTYGPYGMIYVTVSDPSKTRVRCEVQYGDKREWVDIVIKNGSGEAEIGRGSGLPTGSYPVKLLQSPGQCY